MSDPAFDLQVALVTALTALNTEAGERVYDDVPPESDRESDTGAAWPYISIGPGNLVPVDETCWDRSQFFHQIDVWSREIGFPQVKRIAGAIHEALHEKTMPVDGQTLDRMSIQSISYSRDSDGLTSRARILLLTETQPA